MLKHVLKHNVINQQNFKKKLLYYETATPCHTHMSFTSFFKRWIQFMSELPPHNIVVSQHFKTCLWSTCKLNMKDVFMSKMEITSTCR